MNYQLFISIFFLFTLTINYSLTLSYFDQTNDESNENDLQKISNQDHHKWRRHSEFARPTRTNQIKNTKSKIHFLKYDFLLHRWTLRNVKI